MSLGNQRLRANKTSNTTVDALVSPVSTEEFADYLGLDYEPQDDVLLNAHLLTACGWYIAHMNNELLSRNWSLKFDRCPTDGVGLGGLSPDYANLNYWIDIPLYPVTAIADVTAETVSQAFTFDLDSKPPRVFLDNTYIQEIVITYTAGYPSKSDIPPNTILGIFMMASYLYEHRGACDIGSAAMESGAASVWGYNAMILSL
jgi:hypothetical protein